MNLKGIFTDGDIFGYLRRIERECFEANVAVIDEQGSNDAKGEALAELNQIRAEFGLPALTMEHFVGVKE